MLDKRQNETDVDVKMPDIYEVRTYSSEFVLSP